MKENFTGIRKNGAQTFGQIPNSSNHTNSIIFDGQWAK
jgi:hypothetical protein